MKDETEARKKGFKNGDTFKYLKRDFILATDEESRAAREQIAKSRITKA